MSADESGSTQILELISAVAAGDAAREDVVSALRDKGVDSLDVLVEVLAQAKRMDDRGQTSHPLDPQCLSASAPPELTAKTVHRVPTQPFLLRGTLYDPSDISRFNGKELHFLSAPGRDHLLVFDDRSVMESWWQLSYITAGIVSSDLPEYLPAKGGGGYVEPTNYGGGGGGGYVEPTDYGGGGGGGPIIVLGTAEPPPHAKFYEHPNFEGSYLTLPPNEGYPDLTEECYSIWGDSWNDRLSSVHLVRVRVAVLYEHVNYLGSTFSAIGESKKDFGSWNDLASSCGTW